MADRLRTYLGLGCEEPWCFEMSRVVLNSKGKFKWGEAEVLIVFFLRLRALFHRVCF